MGDTKSRLFKNAGLGGQHGHADFYVNGGEDQPRCKRLKTVSKQELCDHYSVVDYFVQHLLMRFAAVPSRISSPANAKAAVEESARLRDIITGPSGITKTERCFIRQRRKRKINVQDQLCLSSRPLGGENRGVSKN